MMSRRRLVLSGTLALLGAGCQADRTPYVGSFGLSTLLFADFTIPIVLVGIVVGFAVLTTFTAVGRIPTNSINGYLAWRRAQGRSVRLLECAAAAIGVIGGFLLYSSEYAAGSLCLGAPGGVLIGLLHAKGIRRRLLSEIDGFDHDDSLTQCIDMLRDRDHEVRSHAMISAVRLLPAASSAELGALSGRQRRILYSSLASLDSPFVYTVLLAISRMGDRSARPYVERLERSFRFGDPGDRVRDATAECLARLRGLEIRASDQERLLRASQGTNGEVDTLLRVARFSREQDSRLVQAVNQPIDGS